MPFAEYAEYDGLGLAELVRRHALSPAEVLEERDFELAVAHLRVPEMA